MITTETPDGTVTIDAAGKRYRVNGGEWAPIPQEWAAWVAGLVAEAQHVAAVTGLRRAIAGRASDLRAAGRVAAADAVTVPARKKAADDAQAAAQAQAAAIRKWTPTLNVASLGLIRDQMAQLADRQALFASAFAEFYTYRGDLDGGYGMSVSATADLADLVAKNL